MPPNTVDKFPDTLGGLGSSLHIIRACGRSIAMELIRVSYGHFPTEIGETMSQGCYKPLWCAQQHWASASPVMRSVRTENR